jgi:hypothetical protein
MRVGASIGGIAQSGVPRDQRGWYRLGVADPRPEDRPPRDPRLHRGGGRRARSRADQHAEDVDPRRGSGESRPSRPPSFETSTARILASRRGLRARGHPSRSRCHPPAGAKGHPVRAERARRVATAHPRRVQDRRRRPLRRAVGQARQCVERRTALHAWGARVEPAPRGLGSRRHRRPTLPARACDRRGAAKERRHRPCARLRPPDALGQGHSGRRHRRARILRSTTGFRPS